MEQTPIDKLYDEYSNIRKLLISHGEISLSNDYDRTMLRVLIVSCASFFEFEMTNMLKEYVSIVTGANVNIISFIEKQALKLRYHTLFDWGEKDNPDKPKTSINKFLKLFDKSFSEKVQKHFDEDEKIDKSKNDFIALGHLRNILVHSNFIEYSYIQKTPEEIFQLYLSARLFIPFIKEQLLN